MTCHPLFVIPKRFERLTHALEGRCSIQLSYGTYLLYGIERCSFPCAKIVRFFGCAKVFLRFFVSVMKCLCKKTDILLFLLSIEILQHLFNCMHSNSSAVQCDVPCILHLVE